MSRLVALLLAVALFISCSQDTEKDKALVKGDQLTTDSVATEADTLNEEYDDFGFRVDTAKVQDHEVLKNESLYLILDKFDFSAQEIYAVTQQARDLIDVRSFKPGQRYRIYASLNEGKNEALTRLVWQPNPLDYVVFDWQDSLQIYKSSKIVTTKIETASAEINSSLYETMVMEELSPLLAYKLSEIYAWEIDFFSLRNGDSFQMIYEKKYIDDTFFEIGDIKAASFTHRGETYNAFKFEDENISGYFDEDGNSVQKALLKAPFKFNQRISSGFSHNRFHPVLKRRLPHYGVDYAAPHGTPVLSVGDGTVTESRYRGANGNIVKIRHNSTYETAYLHLSGFASGIKKGRTVKQGQVIGYVGKTGRVTGTHLDYRIYKNDSPVNPLTVDLPSSESIPASSIDNFKSKRDQFLEELDISTASDNGKMLTENEKVSDKET
ncbi:peptidoglycan DD-metalloendopeptidase family protein [Balneolaceae bacterium YR4-1]|uniref:Peptidoglycan DD-metalloendopeptidase family protein n=1 Tax=Halalkalibaculum roseum TaxID=2709311 RepID=A0A6M1SUX7_9BACT|nr:peptidoglycan DD-metalloendopeptidase family protein [Halalkalibaculum roseum]NGP76750.1 peptidoglycan DD-metalloendopeptidase family protein [Halalkalibaculum roseum]